MKQKLDLLWNTYRGLDWPMQVIIGFAVLMVVSALIQKAVQ